MRTPRHPQAHLIGRIRQGGCAVLAATLVLAAAGCNSAPAAAKSDAGSGASLAGGDSPAVAGEIVPVENGRRVLVIFFSQGSATKRVAEDLAFLLRADIERIVEKKSRRGFFGFMGAGAASTFGLASPIESPVRDPAAYEAVVVCSPIWAWRLAPPVRSWLRLYRGQLPEAAAYVTVSGDTDPARIVAAMAKESGRLPTISAGFADRDFTAEHRSLYLEKIGNVVVRFR